jgi:hypothetical protein
VVNGVATFNALSIDRPGAGYTLVASSSPILTTATSSAFSITTLPTDTIGGYNPSNGVFYLRNSNSGGNADYQFQFGLANAGWKPLAGDWNGDGAATIGGYNPFIGVFYLRNSNSGGNADYQFQFGPADAGWLPIAGDWNGTPSAVQVAPVATATPTQPARPVAPTFVPSRK